MKNKRKNSIPDPPDFPENIVEFNGKFMKESEFKAYKETPSYKREILGDKITMIMFIVALVTLYSTMIILALVGKL